MKKLVVYFNNNNKAMFDVGRIYMVTSKHANSDMIIRDALDGLNVVNWDNVCFVRAFEERDEDADSDNP